MKRSDQTNFALLAACLLLSLTALAQTTTWPQTPIRKPLAYDTTYYKSFKGSIIPRVFLSRNYSHISIDPPAGELPTMKYRANTPLNFGVGIAYHWFSVSISRGLGFLESTGNKGKTKSFDLQTHIYRRKWVFDALAQFYSGYYLAQPDIGNPAQTGYYTRPDMRLRMVGVSGYRVFNDRHFSYGAGLGQGGIQLKSAGSFLMGGNAFYTAINADSSLAPYKADSEYAKQGTRKFHSLAIGAGIGYAYNYVFEKHFFLIGSANINLNVNFSREKGGSVKRSNVGVSPNYILRFATGYNTNKWAFSGGWYTGGIGATGGAPGYKYSVQQGSYRLIYVRRLAIGRRMKEIIRDGYY